MYVVNKEMSFVCLVQRKFSSTYDVKISVNCVVSKNVFIRLSTATDFFFYYG
jgi:hypothetical protein